MIIKSLQSIYERDLKRLYHEIELYKDETAIWRIEKQIANSGGNLCLHLIGNLNEYIGKELGNNNYVRNRDVEFSVTAIPKIVLLETINNTITIISKSLDRVTDKDLANEYPVLMGGEKWNLGHTLIHLSTHLTYHLGQINYHRRMIDC